MNLRVLIVDDEALARERLRRLLSQEADLEIVGECADGPSAIEAVREHAPNLLLLDIQMPGMDGFEVIRALGSKSALEIIFVTAYDEHAVRAFDARALDYLLKPASRSRVHEALTRARERLAANVPSRLPQQLLDLLAEREAASRVQRLAVRTGERVIFVPIEQIDWVEAAGNYAILHAGRENHIVRETMNSLETQLASGNFLRVSRSSILNLRRVKEIQSVAPGEHVAILGDGQRVAMTRSLREVEERMRFG